MAVLLPPADNYINSFCVQQENMTYGAAKNYRQSCHPYIIDMQVESGLAEWATGYRYFGVYTTAQMCSIDEGSGEVCIFQFGESETEWVFPNGEDWQSWLAATSTEPWVEEYGGQVWATPDGPCCEGDIYDLVEVGTAADPFAFYDPDTGNIVCFAYLDYGFKTARVVIEPDGTVGSPVYVFTSTDLISASAYYDNSTGLLHLWGLLNQPDSGYREISHIISTDKGLTWGNNSPSYDNGTFNSCTASATITAGYTLSLTAWHMEARKNPYQHDIVDLFIASGELPDSSESPMYLYHAYTKISDPTIITSTLHPDVLLGPSGSTWQSAGIYKASAIAYKDSDAPENMGFRVWYDAYSTSMVWGGSRMDTVGYTSGLVGITLILTNNDTPDGSYYAAHSATVSASGASGADQIEWAWSDTEPASGTISDLPKSIPIQEGTLWWRGVGDNEYGTGVKETWQSATYFTHINRVCGSDGLDILLSETNAGTITLKSTGNNTIYEAN